MKLRPMYKVKLIAEINKNIFNEYQTYIAVEVHKIIKIDKIY